MDKKHLKGQYKVEVTVSATNKVWAFLYKADGSRVDDDAATDIIAALHRENEPTLNIYVGKSLVQEGLYKIGVSYLPPHRAKRLKIEIVTRWMCSEQTVWRLEATLHDYFVNFNVGGEWFYFPPDGDFQPFAEDSWLRDLINEEELIEAFDTIYASQGIYGWKEDLRRRKRKITSLWKMPKSTSAKKDSSK